MSKSTSKRKIKKPTTKKMGRPTVYDAPRRPRLVQLSDEVWDAIGTIAGEGKRTEYIEKHLRSIPEIAALLEPKGR